MNHSFHSSRVSRVDEIGDGFFGWAYNGEIGSCMCEGSERVERGKRTCFSTQLGSLRLLAFGRSSLRKLCLYCLHRCTLSA